MHHTTPTNLTYDTSKYPCDITYFLFFSLSSHDFLFCVTTLIKHYTKSCTTPWAIFLTSVENKNPTLSTPNGNKMHLQTEPYLQLRVSILVWYNFTLALPTHTFLAFPLVAMLHQPNSLHVPWPPSSAVCYIFTKTTHYSTSLHFLISHASQ